MTLRVSVNPGGLSEHQLVPRFGHAIFRASKVDIGYVLSLVNVAIQRRSAASTEASRVGPRP